MTAETDTKRRKKMVVDNTAQAVPKGRKEITDENVKENWLIMFGELGEVEWRSLDHGFAVPGNKDAKRSVYDKNGKVIGKERFDVFKPKYVPCPATVLIDDTLQGDKIYEDENLTMCGEIPPEDELAGKPLMNWCRAHMASEHAELHYDMNKGVHNPVCSSQYKLDDKDTRREAPPQTFTYEFLEWKEEGDKSRKHMSKSDADYDKVLEAYKEHKGEKETKDEQKAVTEQKNAIETEGQK